MAVTEGRRDSRYTTKGDSNKRRQEDVDTLPHFPCSMREVQTIFKNWVKDGVLVLRSLATPPTEVDKAMDNYCVYHQLVKHPTKDCWALRNIFHQKIADGELQITT